MRERPYLGRRTGWQRPHTAVLVALTAAAVWTSSTGALEAAGETGVQRAKEASSALQRNQADKAVQLYTEALSDTGLPNDRRAAIHNDRGVAHARLNQTRAAIEDFNRAVQLFPESASAYNNRGNVLLAAGSAAEAAKDFDRAILLSPGYAAAYSNRAAARSLLGEREAAIRDFTQASRLTPQIPAPLAGRGRLLLTQKRPYAALRDLDRALSSDSRFGPGYRIRADILMALNRYDDAVEDLNRAAAFDPTSLEIHLLRGHAHLAAHNVPAALKDFSRAAEIDPKSAAAHAGLGFAHATDGALDEALSDLGRALEVDPRSARAYAYRAVVYKRMGQADLGARDLERAQRLESGAAEVAWARGELAEAAGRTDEAVLSLRKALAANTGLHQAAEALDRLGAPRAEEVEVRELSFDDWRVFVRHGQHIAMTPDLGAKFAVPLEMVDDSQPKLLEWDVKTAGHLGVGVLRFSAGRQESPAGPEDVEHAAIIDLQARKLITVEVVREGSRSPEWTWDDSKLTVMGRDGYPRQYVLKASKEVVQQSTERRRVAGPDGFARPSGPPVWAPWSPNYGGSFAQEKPRRQQQPKSLFDMIFKN